MEKVINCFKQSPDAVARLICFPWAGGGSIHYARWGNVLDASIEGNAPGKPRVALCSVTSPSVSSPSLLPTVFAVKLPGREGRAKEPFLQSMQQIVDEVTGALLPLLREKPFALFGHRCGNSWALFPLVAPSCLILTPSSAVF